MITNSEKLLDLYPCGGDEWTKITFSDYSVPVHETTSSWVLLFRSKCTRKHEETNSLTSVLCSSGVLCVYAGRCFMSQEPYYWCLRSTLRFRLALMSSTTTPRKKHLSSSTAYCLLRTHQIRCVYYPRGGRITQ